MPIPVSSEHGNEHSDSTKGEITVITGSQEEPMRAHVIFPIEIYLNQ